MEKKIGGRYQLHVHDDGSVSIVDEETKQQVIGSLKWSEATRLVAKMNRPRKRRMHLGMPEIPSLVLDAAKHLPVLCAVIIWLMFIISWIWFGARMHLGHE